jgi:hypothetical protein
MAHNQEDLNLNLHHCENLKSHTHNIDYKYLVWPS